MDTLIENGDHETDSRGYPYDICSADEACQRARFILSTKKGSFIYDRELGSDHDYLLANADKEGCARLFCEEALSCQKELSLGRVIAEENERGVSLSAEIIYNGESRFTEVFISG